MVTLNWGPLTPFRPGLEFPNTYSASSAVVSGTILVSFELDPADRPGLAGQRPSLRSSCGSCDKGGRLGEKGLRGETRPQVIKREKALHLSSSNYLIDPQEPLKGDRPGWRAVEGSVVGTRRLREQFVGLIRQPWARICGEHRFTSVQILCTCICSAEQRQITSKSRIHTRKKLQIRSYNGQETRYGHRLR